MRIASELLGDRSHMLQVLVHPDDVRRLEEYAQASGVSRSEAMRYLLTMVLDSDAEIRPSPLPPAGSEQVAVNVSCWIEPGLKQRIAEAIADALPPGRKADRMTSRTCRAMLHAGLDMVEPGGDS